MELSRCLHCRHLFKPNHRNEGRTVHPQVYCCKPACQRESGRVSRDRYRLKEKEDPEQVRLRVQAFRKAQQAKGSTGRAPPVPDEGEGRARPGTGTRAQEPGSLEQAARRDGTGGIGSVETRLADRIASRVCRKIHRSLESLIRDGSGPLLHAGPSTGPGGAVTGGLHSA